MALGWRRGYLRYKSYFLNVISVYKRRKDLRMFLEITLSLVTISFFAVFALKPTLLTIAELTKEIKTKEETVVKMDEKIQNLERGQQIYTQEQTKISLLKDAIPSTPVPDSFVRQIEGATTKHPITILGMSIGEVTLIGEEKAQKKSELEALPEGARGVTFSISATSSYLDLAAFLSTLQNLRRPVKIDAATINSSETDIGRFIVLVITGRTPYLRESTQ
jgi:Tfp pilus assembly protein PilO